jgi:hypothetical protein
MTRTIFLSKKGTQGCETFEIWDEESGFFEERRFIQKKTLRQAQGQDAGHFGRVLIEQEIKQKV